jgi:hypothetical protein
MRRAEMGGNEVNTNIKASCVANLMCAKGLEDNPLIDDL